MKTIVKCLSLILSITLVFIACNNSKKSEEAGEMEIVTTTYADTSMVENPETQEMEMKIETKTDTTFVEKIK
jgi:hypothetical protein